jgi:O-acetyl-ADP-ribose deacetylase
MEEKQKPVTTEGIKKLLKFLPVFEQKDYKFVDCITTTFPPAVFYSIEVNQFISLLYDENFIFPFDWGKWQDEAKQLCLDPHALEKADFDTLQKLLTLHVRKERFCEGHLADVLENGHIAAILRRLKEICGNLNYNDNVKSQ